MDTEHRQQRIHRLITIRYVAAGLFLGGVWIWRSGTPPWEHALRLLVVLLVVAPAFRWLRLRLIRRSGMPAGPMFPIRIWVVAKIVLLGVALAVDWLLEKVMTRASAGLVVGAFIAVTVAVGGPVLHRKVLRPPR
jgi:hypothetical protein